MKEKLEKLDDAIKQRDLKAWGTLKKGISQRKIKKYLSYSEYSHYVYLWYGWHGGTKQFLIKQGGGAIPAPAKYYAIDFQSDFFILDFSQLIREFNFMIEKYRNTFPQIDYKENFFPILVTHQAVAEICVGISLENAGEIWCFDFQTAKMKKLFSSFDDFILALIKSNDDRICLLGTPLEDLRNQKKSSFFSHNKKLIEEMEEKFAVIRADFSDDAKWSDFAKLFSEEEDDFEVVNDTQNCNQDELYIAQEYTKSFSSLMLIADKVYFESGSFLVIQYENNHLESFRCSLMYLKLLKANLITGNMSFYDIKNYIG